ncbi:unnamed protein product, partial [Mesorhabditis spiculigera]
MCPEVCSKCPGKGTIQAQGPTGFAPQPNRNKKEAEQQPTFLPQQPPQQQQQQIAQLQTPPRPQTQQNFLPQQFAAPNAQQQQQQQQYQAVVVTAPPPPPDVTPSREQAVTLAPLVRMPSAEELNVQLSEQQRLMTNGLYSQVPQAQQAPDPLGPVGVQSQLGLQQQPGVTPAPTSAMFNPFQPFLQQLGLPVPDQSNPFNLPTFPPHPFFTTPAPVPAGQPQQGQQPYFGQQQQSPYGLQPQQQYPGFGQQVQAQVATNTIQQVQQGQQPQQPQQQNYASNQPQTVVARSIDSAPQTFEKPFYAGAGAAQSKGAEMGQCPRQPGWQPCITKEVANQRFSNCCARLGEGCQSMCNYDANLATMQLAVLTGRCPLQKVRDIMICASGYKDVTQCCQAYNVFEPGFEHCRPYCNPAGGLPEGGLLSEKYKCLAKLSFIQQCFYVSQNP